MVGIVRVLVSRDRGVVVVVKMVLTEKLVAVAAPVSPQQQWQQCLGAVACRGH